MPGLDDRILAAGEPTTLRDLHAAGRLELGRMSHLDADDWAGGADLFYAQHMDTREMWPIARADFEALGGDPGDPLDAEDRVSAPSR